MLFHLNKIDEIDTKLHSTDGIVMLLFQTHKNMNIAIPYMPKYFITSFFKKIPGILYQNSCFKFNKKKI